MKYIYPSLSEQDLGFIRLGGAGLANCLYVACRAYSYAKKYQAEMIRPTWEKISVGPYLRREKDKRHYGGLFNESGITGFKKFRLIHSRVYSEAEMDCFTRDENGILKVSGLGQYFQDLVHEDSVEYLSSVIQDSTLAGLEGENFDKTVAVHIRLGDYPEYRRTPVSWYKKEIDKILSLNGQVKISVFSDGTDAELAEILSCPNTRRVFYGNALADIYAISRAKLVIASDSTFSAWGAFLGQLPAVFYKRHFPPVFDSAKNLEFVLGDEEELPDAIQKVVVQI